MQKILDTIYNNIVINQFNILIKFINNLLYKLFKFEINIYKCLFVYIKSEYYYF